MLTTEQANALLPQKKHGEKADPKKLIYLFIAEAKFGKTTWMSAIENSLLLAFEKGHAFIEAYKMNITAWSAKDSEVTEIDGLTHATFTDALDVICSSDQFDFIIFDTADAAVKMCLDYNMKKLGITHPSDWEFGKGYEASQNTPFRQAINRLTSTGRGVGFITHTETKDSRFSSGAKSRKECTLPGGISKLLVPMADCILHGRFGLRNKATGRRDRIIVTEGSDDMLAGGRVQRTAKLPVHFIVDENDPWAQWVSFFNDPKASEAAEDYYEKRKHSNSPTGTEQTDVETSPSPKKSIAKATKPPKEKAAV